MADALVLHGLSSNARSTHLFTTLLAEYGLDAVAPDLRGHGAAEPRDDYSLDAYVADIAALTPSGGRWRIAIGHSLGGAILVRAQAADPGFAELLVLVDPAIVLDDAGLDDLGAAFDTAPTEQELRTAHPTWGEADIAAKLESGVQFDPATARATTDQNRPWDLRAEVAALQVPTLVLAADPHRDALVSPQLAGELDVNGFVDVVTVPGAGHSIHRDDPQSTRRMIGAWLDEKLGI